MTQEAALIGLDWGTSSLRAYLFDKTGKVISTRQEPWGIMALPVPAEQGGFPLALERICDGWLQANPNLPVLACGMVGSQQGWEEAAYFDCPANPEGLAGAFAEVRFGNDRKAHIVPGLIVRGAQPDVMRGEETQIVGAMEMIGAGERDGGATIVMPGTHSKWVAIDKDTISGFSTFMTGEVFAALSQHTILSRLMTKAEDAEADREATFQRGLELARRKDNGGLLAAIFSTRTLGLTEQVPGHALADFLSGLLIGLEIVGAQEKLNAATKVYLVGSEGLSARYGKALKVFGFTPVTLEGATQLGLWHIARAAGFVK